MALLFAGSSLAQFDGESFTGASAKLQSLNPEPGLLQIPNKVATLTFYTDRAAFEAVAPDLPKETFDESPVPLAGVLECSDPVTSGGGGACFVAGDIEAGLSVGSSSGAGVVSLGADLLPGLPSPGIAANFFADSTVLEFSTGNAFAVGFDLIISGPDSPVDITVFDEGGSVVGATSTTSGINGAFVGVISDVAIGAIDVRSTPGFGEILDNVCFGTVTVDARVLKQDAIDILSAVLPSGDKKTDKTIGKAISKIEKSLADDLWVDDSHLDKKRGKKVFDEEKKAVKELDKLLDDSDSDSGSDSDSDSDSTPLAALEAAVEAIANLLTADAQLAQTALDEAIAAAEAAGCDLTADNGDSDSDSGSDSDSDSGSDSDSDSDSEAECDCAKASREITKAQEELVKAQADIDAGKFDKAIDHYKKAWEKACKALQAVAGCALCPCWTPDLLTAVTAENQLPGASCVADTDVAVIQNIPGSTPGVEGGFAAVFTAGSCSTRDLPPFFLPVTPEELLACDRQIRARCAAIGTPTP